MRFYKFFTCMYLLKPNSAFIFKNNNYLTTKTMSLHMKKNGKSLQKLYIPKTSNQEKYVEYLNDNNCSIVISIGPAGTGKTMFACQKAISLLKYSGVQKIIITRPVVTVEEELGFLPGNIMKKMDPWTKPLFDIFLEHYSSSEFDLMLKNNVIEICPLAFMRGRTFKNSFIIADEMQNSSPNQMKMLATRLGESSKMVITGDLKQTDILKNNGLQDIVKRLELYNSKNNATNMLRLVEFNNSDIERSDIVKKIIEIYEYDYNENNENNKNNKTAIVNLISNFSNNTDCNYNNNSNVYNKYKISLDKDKLNTDAALIPFHHYYKI